MARKPVVTKTLRVTDATLLCVNVDTEEVSRQNVQVNGFFEDADKLFKKAKEVLPETFKPVHLVSYERLLMQYVMPLDEFKVAAKLSKSVSADAVEDEEL